MFEITPSTEFSAWFESLSPELAEEVACAIDLLSEAGVALEPSRTSRTLLWYDGCAGGLVNDPFASLGGAPSVMHAFDDVRELLLWHREVVRCLESGAFRERLARLDPQAASVALLAVENLKVRLKAMSRWIAVGGYTARLPKPRGNELKESFFQVLRLVGLEPAQVVDSPSGLCELVIPSTCPALRVLFGLDAPGQRILLLLGEAMTRSYYGDSVTLAERLWLRYCAEPSARTVSPQEP
ncbi:MAG: hypothetical protein ABUL62_12875 [Myxococcales bacterium]